MRKLYTKPIPPPTPSDFRAPVEVVISGQVIVVRFDPHSGEFHARAKIGKWFYVYSANNRERLVAELHADIFHGGPRTRGYGRRTV